VRIHSADPSVWALVPVKPFAQAKSRLRDVLGAPERAAFARSMVEHVLTVLRDAPEIAGTLVVTSCPEATALARSLGAAVVRDPEAAKLAAIVDHGLADLAARGAPAALVLMSDLPRLAASDVRRLVELLADHDVVAVPDQSGDFTNALALRPPDRLLTSFGSRGSFDRHLASARAAGLRAAVHESPGLAFDVDEPADLERAT
jgi:2-phospho-L-lactate/phosphoenolpyruvate guanylyltransferase